MKQILFEGGDGESEPENSNLWRGTGPQGQWRALGEQKPEGKGNESRITAWEPAAFCRILSVWCKGLYKSLEIYNQVYINLLEGCKK